VALPVQMSVEGGKALAGNLPENPLEPPLAA
jgi:hypothetical protein